MMESGWDGKTNRISYTKYATLPQVLRRLLEDSEDKEPSDPASAENVFPALDIIRRAGPPESIRAELFSLISAYLGSRIWHVREIAARTLCSFLLNETWLSEMAALAISSKGNCNRAHGILLTAKFLLERLSKELISPGKDHINISIYSQISYIANGPKKNCWIFNALLRVEFYPRQGNQPR